MGAKAVIILLTFLVNILSPPVLTADLAQDGQTIIANLDVCHDAHLNLSSEDHEPYLNEGLTGYFPLVSISYNKNCRQAINLPDIEFPNDHPPEI